MEHGGGGALHPEGWRPDGTITIRVATTAAVIDASQGEEEAAAAERAAGRRRAAPRRRRRRRRRRREQPQEADEVSKEQSLFSTSPCSEGAYATTISRHAAARVWVRLWVGDGVMRCHALVTSAADKLCSS